MKYIKTFNENTTSNIKEGDIIILNLKHIARGAKVLARVKEIFPKLEGQTRQIADVEYIKCEVEPYLCDIDYTTITNIDDPNLQITSDELLKSLNIK